jgi:hypothetical protein
MYRKLLSAIAPACHFLDRNVAHQLQRSKSVSRVGGTTDLPNTAA